MKKNVITKKIASIITIVIIFQYVSIIAPLLKVNAEQGECTDGNGITWDYSDVNMGAALGERCAD